MHMLTYKYNFISKAMVPNEKLLQFILCENGHT